MLRLLLVLCSTIAGLHAQAPVGFEVASIKPSETPTAAQLRTGQALMGARIDGARADFGNVSLQELITRVPDPAISDQWANLDRQHEIRHRR